MPSALERKRLALASVLFLALVSLPYIYAALSAGPDLVFGGFLLNPIDGYTYLAKMRQGLAGAWSFTLPYSAEPGDPAAINLYYLFLGHLARWLGAPLLLVFHAARLTAAALMLRALYALCASIFVETKSRWYAFLLASFGSGLGWAAILFGLFTPDFWVSEAYPFLSAYANAHFPLGLAIQIHLFTQWQLGEKLNNLARTKTILLSAVLAIVYPFGLALVGLVIAAEFLFRIAARRSTQAAFQQLLLLAIAGGPIALYQLWIVNTHPVLSVWNAQNLTPTPAPIELLISLSPALLIAIVGTIIARQIKATTHLSTLLIWIFLSLIIAYLPINVQRRMLSGIFIPLALVAIYALESLTSNWQRGTRLVSILLVLSVPTNLLVIISGLNAARHMDESIYLQRTELAAYHWLDENASDGDLLMASPSSGLLVPAYSPLRVLYGHPFETVDAEKWLQLVNNFYSQPDSAAAQLEGLGVNYVLYGPRESLLGDLPILPAWKLVFENQDARIFAPLP